MEKLIKKILSIAQFGFWGTITISFKDGVPTKIEKYESIKI